MNYRSSLRLQAAGKVIAGLIGCGCVLAIVIWLEDKGHNAHFPLIILVAPFAYGCIGVVEFLTGTPIRQIAARWALLPRWQQRSLGLLLMAFGAVVVSYLVWLLFRWVI